jgi:hypothetical protein
MRGQLIRYGYTPEGTLGRMRLGEFACHTLECPWLDEGGRAGKPFDSCIPDGLYRLGPYTRANGTPALVLINETLGVFEHLVDRLFDTDRYGALIHAGNWLKDTQGCILVGDRRLIDVQRRQMVTNSKASLEFLLEAYAALPGGNHELLIRRTRGAVHRPRA